MAIGDGGNSTSGNKVFEPTYYSRFRLSRTEAQGISITYRSGLMILELNKLEDGFKTTPLISIFLSPIKAGLLAKQIEEGLFPYMEDKKIDPNVGFGVNAGMNEKVTFIAFSTDSDKNIFATIGKFDGTGTIVESYKYQFANDYNYALHWKNVESNNLEKVYDNNIEIAMLVQALKDFSRSASGALGYGTLDLNRYQKNQEYKRIDQVMDKLGIERRSNGGSYNRGDNNFLNNAGSSKSTSVEEIEDLLA